jgi:hypothetical protein
VTTVQEKTFSTPEVAGFTGASFRNLDYWVRNGSVGWYVDGDDEIEVVDQQESLL